MNDALGLLETTGFTPAMVALDAMEKTAGIEVVQAELNDRLGVCVKVSGMLADVESALHVAVPLAERMGGSPVAQILARCDPAAKPVMISPPEFNPLIQQDVVHNPPQPKRPGNQPDEEHTVATHYDALGFIETQGFTAVFDAVDTACKAANVQVLGKEKLGGGYVTVIIHGDVAAVQAAIAAAAPRVQQLGTLIAAHVVTRPSPAVTGLLPG